MKQLPYNSNVQETDTGAFLYVLGGLVLLGIVFAWPLATIWALNTLFALNLGYTFWNWLATWILVWSFQGALKISRKTAK